MLSKADPVAMWAFSACTLDCGFESHLQHGRLSLVSVYCVLLCTWQADHLSKQSYCMLYKLIKKPLYWPYTPEVVIGNIPTHTYIQSVICISRLSIMLVSKSSTKPYYWYVNLVFLKITYSGTQMFLIF
jgi:hypothetical protein